jgi:prefoldin beta subunit
MADEKNNLGDLQIIEQASQNLLMQKQIFQIELAETNNALENLKDASDEVYKIVGNLMFKANKENLKKELERKKQLLDLRVKAIEKQEEDLNKKFDKVRDEVLKDAKKE